MKLAAILILGLAAIVCLIVAYCFRKPKERMMPAEFSRRFDAEHPLPLERH